MSTSTPNTSTNQSLSDTELANISMRVDKVTALITKSAALWLEVGSECATAKVTLTQLGYERFINDVGFTKAVADKLVLIGKCNRLYATDAAPHIGSVDGWSVFYEITKLTDAQIDDLWKTLTSNPTLKLSRSVVHNIANGNNATDRMLVFVTIGAQESQIGSLTTTQIEEFQKKLAELRAMFDNVPKAIEFKEREANVKLLIVSTTSRSNNNAAIVETAA